MTVRYNNIIYRSEKSAVNKNDALDAAIDKIIRQIRKNKTRVEKMVKKGAFVIDEGDDDEYIGCNDVCGMCRDSLLK